MVQQIKTHYGLPDRGLTQPLKVVISQRQEAPNQPPAARALTNAAQLAAALEARGLAVEVRISFYSHTTGQQGLQ